MLDFGRDCDVVNRVSWTEVMNLDEAGDEEGHR